MSAESVRTQLQDHLQQAAELAGALPGADGGADEMFPGWVRDWTGLLVAQWKLLGAGALVATVAAGAILLLLPRTYSAEALIAPTRNLTQVQFEPSIRTVDSASGAAVNATATTPERRQAYVDLVKSSEVEAVVIAQLRGIVPASDLVPGQFIDHVSGAIKPKSEIISIQAQADTPEAAVAIANTWAAAYLDRVNRIYTRSSGAATGLDAQSLQFLEQYNDAEAALTADLRTNRLEELDRQIQEKQQSARLLQSTYQAGRFEGVTGVGGQGGAAASAPGGGSATALDTQAAREDFRLAEVQALNVLARKVQQLSAARDSVRTLLGQATSVGLGPSDTAAIAMLKVQLAAGSAALAQNLQFQLPPTTGTESVAGLRALADSIDRSLAEASQEFQARSTDYEKRRTEQIAQIEADLRDLQARREAAFATRQNLSLARELAWKTYSAVANKLQERAVADATSGREVELASQATIGQPTPRRAPLVLGLTALLGFGVAAIVALVRGRAFPAHGVGLL